MHKLYFLINFIIILGYFGPAFGAPSVSSISGTADAQGQLTLKGSGFGSNGLDYTWLGSNIENGQAGEEFSASGWGATADSTGLRAPRYTSEKSHSGNKSILSSYTPAAYDSSYWYAFGKEAQKLYATYWIFVDLAGMKGQNKLWRIMGVPEQFRDLYTVLMASQWNNNSSYMCLFSKGDSQSYWYSTDTEKDGIIQLFEDEIPGFGKWARLEIYFEGGTPYTKNGTMIYKIHKNGQITQTRVNFDGSLMLYNGTSMRAKGFTIQNYVGNAADGYPRTGNEKIFTDDVFIQVGSQARVEIGDKSTWSNCTYREVQVPTSWTSSQIKATVNAGKFSSGQTAYVYVVDSSGNVNSQGYPIKIGSNLIAETPVDEDSSDDDSADDDTADDDTVDEDSNSTTSMSEAWNALDQSGASGWLNSTWTFCMRLLIEGSSITSSGNRFQLGFQGRNSGNYQIRKVSLAERDMNGSVGDVVDGKWIRVTFDGNDESTWSSDVTTIPANTEKLSNPIPYTIEAGKDYYVTVMIDTPGVYIVAPTGYKELVFKGSDHTEELDWGSNEHTTYDARMHALSSIYIDNKGIPEPNGLMTIANP